MNSRVSIIVLNFNGTSDTIECLESLFSSEESNFNLIIVDNGSDKNNNEILLAWCQSKFTAINCISKEKALETKFEDLCFSNKVVTFIMNDENFGFAIANNIGTRFAILNGSEEILLLNNDTIVTPYFLTTLLNFMHENPAYVAVTPKICMADPKDIIWNCGGKITWFGNRRYYYSGSNISELPRISYSDITFITGCALFYKPLITGILTEQFFFGEEDFEFSLRLLKKKQKVACVYDSVIYHKVGNSVKSNFSETFNRFFLHYVSRLINHKNYYSGSFRWFIKYLNLLYGFYLILIKYNQGFIKSVNFFTKVNRYVKTHNQITKDDFFTIMHLHF